MNKEVRGTNKYKQAVTGKFLDFEVFAKICQDLDQYRFFAEHLSVL